LREFVDPKLGDKSIEKSYADDCRIYIPDHPISPWFNILDKIDVFITAHFVGWFFKMVIVRDFKLCQIQSVMFEILEITFRHWLPNFWECWWDHIFLDLIICNTGGMIIGYYFLKYFKV
jgi:phosphatidylserine synthase 2